MSRSNDNVVRSPQQQRSKQRSEQILAAARAIILQKGCANLTISEIAEVAGVTPGSMYQYYRNKAAIVLALGQYYVELSQQQLAHIFTEPVTSREQLATLFLQVLEQHYQLYRRSCCARYLGRCCNRQSDAGSGATGQRTTSAVFLLGGNAVIPASGIC